MKASARLEKRNDILEVIAEIDSELSGLVGVRSFRAAQQMREKLDIRRGLVTELNLLGFKGPELDERLKYRAGIRNGPRDSVSGGGRDSGDCVVAKRRLGSSPQAG